MLENLTQEQKKRYLEQLEVNEDRAVMATWNYNDQIFDEEHQDLTMESQHAPIARYMTNLPEEAELFGLATPEQLRTETRSERKRREAWEKQNRKAIAAIKKADKLESSASEMRLDQKMSVILDQTGKREEYREAAYKKEEKILEARLYALEQTELADIKKEEMNGTMGEVREKEIRLEAQKARVDAYHTIATQLNPGSAERIKYMKRKEEAVLKRGLLAQELKVARMPAGAEKERDAATIKRHAKYDDLKKIFRTVSPFSREDAEIAFEGNKLINKGRATLGGTKAMYEFEERNAQGDLTGDTYLFKEATNCIGKYKPDGAIVTEEASQLQQHLRGALSIKAKCIRDENNKVAGSVQKKVQKFQGGVDLFKWQAQSDLSVNEPSQITKNDLMNEHTLDWMLCNFDTKGENFINQAGGHIISFDKEASFNTLLQEESKKMSYTFKPHSNDTIYNTMFAAYAQGKIELNLDANIESIRKMEQIDPNSFIRMFKDTLDTKYGVGSKDRAKAEEILRARHRDLRKTYREFYSTLIKERLENTRHPEEREKLQNLLVDNTFVFADEREGWTD